MTEFLAGQTAVVIGGSSGIGRATAVRLKDLGASVTIAGRSKERLEAVSKGVEWPVSM